MDAEQLNYKAPVAGSLLRFTVYPYQCCLPTVQVCGLIRPPHFSRLPFSGEDVVGVFNFQGELATCYDLRSRFSLPFRDDSQSGIVMLGRHGEALVAFWVDEVATIIAGDCCDRQPLPALMGPARRVFNRCYLDDSEIILETSITQLTEVGRLSGDPAVPGLSPLSGRTRQSQGNNQLVIGSVGMPVVGSAAMPGWSISPPHRPVSIAIASSILNDIPGDVTEPVPIQLPGVTTASYALPPSTDSLIPDSNLTTPDNITADDVVNSALMDSKETGRDSRSEFVVQLPAPSAPDHSHVMPLTRHKSDVIPGPVVQNRAGQAATAANDILNASIVETTLRWPNPEDAFNRVFPTDTASLQAVTRESAVVAMAANHLSVADAQSDGVKPRPSGFFRLGIVAMVIVLFMSIALPWSREDATGSASEMMSLHNAARDIFEREGLARTEATGQREVTESGSQRQEVFRLEEAGLVMRVERYVDKPIESTELNSHLVSTDNELLSDEAVTDTAPAIILEPNQQLVSSQQAAVINSSTMTTDEIFMQNTAAMPGEMMSMDSEPVHLPATAPVITRISHHIVIRGDTLWAIAQRYLGDPYRYSQLAQLSRITDPDLIYPGDRVTMEVSESAEAGL